MKLLSSIITFLILTSTLYSQSFTIDENNIVRCKDVPIGTTKVILGENYEVVDRALLEQRRDEGADLRPSCVSNISNMENLFFSVDFNQPIGNWDVSSVTNMRGMFTGSTFNQPIKNWDVSNVTNMKIMFFQSIFKQVIENWDVSKVKNMRGMFFASRFTMQIGD